METKMTSSWIRGIPLYTEAKQQSGERQHPLEPNPQQFKQTQSASKVIELCFGKGVLLVNFLPARITANADSTILLAVVLRNKEEIWKGNSEPVKRDVE